jgi:hypothetical protein
MREPEPFTTRRRRDLERDATKLRLAHWAAGGCRVSAYMLAHGCGFADALDGLAAGNPRPAVVYDIADYRDADADA